MWSVYHLYRPVLLVKASISLFSGESVHYLLFNWNRHHCGSAIDFFVGSYLVILFMSDPSHPAIFLITHFSDISLLIDLRTTVLIPEIVNYILLLFWKSIKTYTHSLSPAYNDQILFVSLSICYSFRVFFTSNKEKKHSYVNESYFLFCQFVRRTVELRFIVNIFFLIELRILRNYFAN